ncbi:MAG: efflux RND transporter permease subunit [Candidatus Brocadia sp.]
MKNYVRILLKFRITILSCIILITAFFGYYAREMRTDNSIEIWLSKNDDDLDYYKTFLKKFGDEEFLVVAFSAANIFTKDCIQEINSIAEKLKKLDDIVNLYSLADVFKDKVTSPVFREKIRSQQGRPLMNIFKQQLLTDPLYRNIIISQNGKTTAIIATVKCAGPESRKQLVSNVKKILYETTVGSVNTVNKKHRYHLAGPSVVNAELDRMSKRDMTKFTPLMFAMSIIVLGCLFRKISGVLIPILTVGVCIIWIAGCFALSGQTMNMISNMLFPLTFIIALSASIHLIGHYYHESKFSMSKEDAIYNTLRHVGIPILMTSITTAIGFLSLTTSSIPPVFITGLFMGGCAALTFIICMTLIPVLLSFVPSHRFMDAENRVLPENPLAERPNRERGFGLLLSGLGRFIVNYKGYVLISSLVVGLFFVWGISKLQVESDLMASFPKNSQIARDNAHIERHIMGLLPVEIVASATNGISVLQPGILNNLVNLQKYLRGIPEVTGSLSVANYIQKTHQFVNDDKPQYYSIPDTEKESRDYIKLASVYGDKYVNSLYTKGHTDARISVRMKQVGSNRYQAVIRSIKEYIHRHLDTTVLSWHITGIVPLLISVQDNILRSEVQSFSLAFLLTFISTAVVLKSVKIGLISVIPNLLPSTITLGLMGLTGMKLDAATIMIASIALGISVDNTIHIFYRFKKEVSVSGDYSTAVCQTLQGVGKTALFTSLSAAFGFMVFSFSSFKPVQYFGVLTSVTMLNAIISDLFISPSCLMLFKPRF